MTAARKKKAKIIVSRCMECACIYGCNIPTEEGNIKKKICVECPEKHYCVYRVVIMTLEMLDKDQRDCEVCTNRANCVRWPKKAKKNCFICENRDRCQHTYMISMTDHDAVVSHGYCTDECRVLANPNVLFDDKTISKVFRNCPQKDINELLFLLQSLDRVSKIIAPESGYTPINEVTEMKKMLLRSMIAKSKNNSMMTMMQM